MKPKLLLITVIFLIIGFFVVLILHYINQNLEIKKSVSVTRIDGRGIFVGDQNKILSGESIQERIGREISEAGENIRRGRNYFSSGHYEQAAEAFRAAYMPRYGEKAVGGLNLARSYEKLGRYDEGITLLDQMIQNGELSEKGIQNANEIKSRLLAAKAAQQKEEPVSQRNAS